MAYTRYKRPYYRSSYSRPRFKRDWRSKKRLNGLFRALPRIKARAMFIAGLIVGVTILLFIDKPMVRSASSKVKSIVPGSVRTSLGV